MTESKSPVTVLTSRVLLTCAKFVESVEPIAALNKNRELAINVLAFIVLALIVGAARLAILSVEVVIELAVTVDTFIVENTVLEPNRDDVYVSCSVVVFSTLSAGVSILISAK